MPDLSFRCPGCGRYVARTDSGLWLCAYCDRRWRRLDAEGRPTDEILASSEVTPAEVRALVETLGESLTDCGLAGVHAGSFLGFVASRQPQLVRGWVEVKLAEHKRLCESRPQTVFGLDLSADIFLFDWSNNFLEGAIGEAEHDRLLAEWLSLDSLARREFRRLQAEHPSAEHPSEETL